MTRCTQQRAWQLISALGPVDAGRLTGHNLRYHTIAAVPSGTLAPDAAQTLKSSLYRRPHQPVTGDTIFYVVCSDRTPVAWLTHDATVITPPAELTSYQLTHQQQAVIALSQLTRHAIAELASLRDQHEQRTPGPSPDPRDTGTRVLAAARTDLTLTWWTGISGDFADSRRHLAGVTDTAASPQPDDPASSGVLLVDTYGYGDYGRHRKVLDLAVFCAIERLAAISELPPWVIGDWLHLHGASTTDPTTEQITDAFTDAYAGLYDSRRAFAGSERDRHGWSTALAAAGIPTQYFDLDAFVAHLFHDQVHDVRFGDGRIAVFRR